MNSRKQALDKATTLIEALPWMSRFHGRTVVVKYGGNAMTDPELQDRFAENIVFLRYAGLRPVVVHGGGPQIKAHLERVGLESTFAGGLRVTTPETMDIVRMVLVGQVNRDIVGRINRHGPFAVGLSGEDARLMTAERKPAMVDGEPVDIGLVGEVTEVDATVVDTLLDDGRIPVVSSVARSGEGVYNVNADTAAAALAAGLGASKLIMLTDIEGLYADYPVCEELISRLSATELERLLPDLSTGMVPKMEACLRAVRGGVPQAHVLDGRTPNSLLLEVFTNDGIGTMVVPDDAPLDVFGGPA
ncbi:acetylglutamate kinase [Nocardiopsis sp. RSe5-2]|uniref:Acetylglutamate kinase n=1 Tax=Nocardiopsis endophytica TaxID=3018445 RepID=A0ABT4UCD2_9ACTN|nr:acetylglutamate kinase [Nocardiopsis endophytica]MDA2814645.1 acetylglutamate kinase [Nocardiopsis endophytica]